MSPNGPDGQQWLSTRVSNDGSLNREYDDLLDASHASSVFLTADWINTWVEIFGPEHRLATIGVRSGDRLIGSTTLAIKTTPGPSQLRRLTIAGQHPTSGEHLDLVARPGFEADVARAVADRLATTLRRRWDVLTIQRMRADSEVLPHFQAALAEGGCHTTVHETGSSPYLALPDDPARLLAAMSRNFRGQVNQSRNRVGRLGDTELVLAGTDIELEPAMDELFRLHELRWGDDSAFTTAEKEAFHRRLARRLLDRKQLYLALLMLDGEAIAARYDYVFDGKIWCMQGGWDPAYQDARLGTFTTEAVIRWGIREGLREYDFLAGDHGYKNRWADKGRPLVTLVAANPQTVRGRLYQRLRSA